MFTKVCATILPLFALVTFLVSACGDDRKFPETITVNEDDVVVIFANSELVVGENRFTIGLLGPDGLPIVDGDVRMSFYNLNGGDEVRHSEADAVSRVPARDAGITEQVEHMHADGTSHTHFNVGEEFGAYTAYVTFDEPGDWGVEISVEKGDINETLRPRFNVLSEGSTPPIGADAPRSRNLTVDDVEDISVIDTSANPSEEMHTTTIAEAIEDGKPTLVLFAVPGYCTSRLCGPELEIMRKLYPEWRDTVEFIHVEFYKNPGDSRPEVADTVAEWNLRTEPWFFVIDSQGKIAAKFEGPTGMDELVDALQAVSAS